MTIFLGGEELDKDLLWENEFDNPRISQNVSRSVLGRQVIQTMPLIGGRVVNLVAKSTGNTFEGSFTRTQVKMFKDWEESQSQLTFEYNGQTFEVIIQAGGVQTVPLIARPDQEDTDLYVGTLILIEV